MAAPRSSSASASGSGRGVRSGSPAPQPQPQSAAPRAPSPPAPSIPPQEVQRALVEIWWKDVCASTLPDDPHERQEEALRRFVALLQSLQRHDGERERDSAAGVRPWPWWTVGDDSEGAPDHLFVSESVKFSGLKAAFCRLPVSPGERRVALASYSGAILTEAQYAQMPMLVPTAVHAHCLSFQHVNYVIVGRPTQPGSHVNHDDVRHSNVHFSWSKGAVTPPLVAADGCVRKAGVVFHHHCTIQADNKSIAPGAEVGLHYGRTFWDRPYSCAVCLLKEKCRADCDDPQCFQCNLPFRRCAKKPCKGKFGFHEACLQSHLALRSSPAAAAPAAAAPAAAAKVPAGHTALCPFHDANRRADTDAEMEQETRTVAVADPLLTLHAGSPFCKVSLRSSDVDLLDPTPLDAVAATLASRGVVHVRLAASLEVIAGMASSAIKWLAEKCPKHKETGATVEVTRDSVREVETSTDLDPKATPLGDLVDRLLADPQLLQLARHVTGPGAAIFPEVYVRIRHPDHYTQLHSDHSFFAKRNLLQADPVCTVWIPLQACGPATGALLLLPETNALKQSTSLIPKSMCKDLWRRIGSSGYKVSSANLALGSALVFRPTVVHGGATCDQSARAPRCSIDVRFLARPVSNALPSPMPPLTVVPHEARIALIASVVDAVTAQCVKKIPAVAPALAGDLLNNVYLFHLFLTAHPKAPPVQSNLRSLIDAAKAPLVAHYKSTFDHQQRNQCRVIWPELARSSKSSGCGRGGSREKENLSSSVDQDSNNLKDLCSRLEQFAAVGSDGQSDLTAFTRTLKNWSTIICYQSIGDQCGDSRELQSHLTQLTALWPFLTSTSMRRIAALCNQGKAGHQWKSFAVALLYLATHCIFAQTMYQTNSKQMHLIISFPAISRLLVLPEVVALLQAWNHAELLTEIAAVSTHLGRAGHRKLRHALPCRPSIHGWVVLLFCALAAMVCC